MPPKNHQSITYETDEKGIVLTECPFGMTYKIKNDTIKPLWAHGLAESANITNIKTSVASL